MHVLCLSECNVRRAKVNNLTHHPQQRDIQMQGLPATVTIASQPCTILRIKRKRNEEPLDALGKTLVNYMNHISLYNSCGLSRQEKEVSWWRWCVPVCPNGRERCLGRCATAKRHSGGLSFPSLKYQIFIELFLSNRPRYPSFLLKLQQRQNGNLYRPPQI